MSGARFRLLLFAVLGAIALVALAGPSPTAAQEPASSADVAAVVGPPRGAPLSGAALEARTEDVGGLLRCPVCQGLSVADSPAGMAVAMKAQVKELLAQGYQQEQILAYFEHSYGEFVRLEPPLRGVNWLVWLGPVLALVAGGAVIAWVLRARRTPLPAADSASAPAPLPDSLPEDPELAGYVRKVRELAYGWPGGVPPKESR